MFYRLASFCFMLWIVCAGAGRAPAMAQSTDASEADWQRAEAQLMFAFDRHVPHSASFVEAQVLRGSLRMLLNLIRSQTQHPPPPERLAAQAISRMEDFGHRPALNGRDGLISLFEIAVTAMTGAIDRYSQFVPSLAAQPRRARLFGEVFEMGLNLVPVPEGMLVRNVTPTRRGDQAGLQIGDIIVRVDDAALTDTDLETAAVLLDSFGDRDLTLLLRRPGLPDLTPLVIPSGGSAAQRSESIRIGDVIYIKLRSFGADAREMIEREIVFSGGLDRPGSRGLILDLRGNSGGDLEQGAQVANAFLDTGTIVSIDDRNPAFTAIYDAVPGDLARGLPVIVLIDRFSASASEMVAAALQDHDRGLIVGAPSMGKGTVQTVYSIGALGSVYLTTGRFYRPSGQPLQGRPVQPDMLLTSGGLNRTGLPAERCPTVPGARDAWVSCAVGVIQAGGIDSFLMDPARTPSRQ